MKTSIRLAFPALLFLAACGGSSTPVTTSGPLDVDQVGNLVTSLGSSLAGQPLTAAAELPSAGDPTYNGVIAIAQTGNPANDPTSAIGTVSLTANLATDTISGTATNFYDRGATPLLGSIPLSSGTINRANLGTTTSAIEGLTLLSNNANELTRNGVPYGWGTIVMDGSFFSNDADFVNVSGTRDTVVSGSVVEITAVITAEK